MKIEVTDKEGNAHVGVGGGFLHDIEDWDGAVIEIGFHLDYGDGSGQTWDVSDLRTVTMHF